MNEAHKAAIKEGRILKGAIDKIMSGKENTLTNLEIGVCLEALATLSRVQKENLKEKKDGKHKGL